MPRDGTETYILPFPDVVEDTTIESTVYNGFTADVAQDLNTPRPVSAGGTGSTNAHDAMIALKGEIANQIVTNYDSFSFVSGSFYSAAGATGAPNANAFAGICYSNSGSGDIGLEARDNTDAKLYLRAKTGGTWGTWVAEDFINDARYVNTTGDTMTGPLVATSFQAGEAVLSGTSLELGSQIGAGPALIDLHSSGTTADYDTRIISNGGSATLGQGVLTFEGIGHKFGGDVTVKYNSPVGTLFFGNTSTKYLQYDGTNFNMAGGNLYGGAGIYATSDIIAGVSSTTDGIYRFGNNGTRYLTCSGGNYSFGVGSVSMPAGLTVGTILNVGSSIELGSLSAAGPAFIDFHSSGTGNDFDCRIISSGGSGAGSNGTLTYSAASHIFGGTLQAAGIESTAATIGGTGYRTRNNGTSGPYGADTFNFFWNGSVMSGWINTSNIGNVSDPRLKHAIEPLFEVLPILNSLKPCTFRFRDVGAYKDDGRRRPGLLSTDIHKHIPGAIEMGTPNELNEHGEPLYNTLAVLPLIAVLVKGIQELTARVEALEAR